MNKIRLHLGCGTVYLLDFINVDVENSGLRLASGFPNGVAIHGTPSTDYYGRLADVENLLKSGTVVDNRSTAVCDVFGSWMALPFADGSASEVLAHQTFEHLDHRHAEMALAETRRVLEPGGILRLSVPHRDGIKAAMDEALRRGDQHTFDFMFRHFLGSAKSPWAYHSMAWNRLELVDLLASWGFECLGDEEPIHFYPSLFLKFKRVDSSHHPAYDEQVIPWKAAYEYAGLDYVQPEWQCLEVGPGTQPWPRANHYVDIVDRNIDRDKFSICDICELHTHIGDRHFDFVYASHVLEHVVDPIKAASELNRVAKRGCIVCPSPMKDGLFIFHDETHLWRVFSSGEVLYFSPVPEGFYEKVRGPDVSGQMHRMLRYGDPRLEDLSILARRWWKNAEPHFDVIHKFEGELKVKVIE